MSRNLLHKTMLEPFKVWLTAEGIKHRPPRGDYDVLQVQNRAPEWLCIFDRDAAPEHYTVDRRLVQMVRRFIRETRGDY